MRRSLKLKHAKAVTIVKWRCRVWLNMILNLSPEEMSFDQQLLHIAQPMQYLCKTYLNGKANTIQVPDSNLDKDATIKVLNSVYDYAIATLEDFKSEQLSDTVSFFIRPMNKLQILNLLNDHQTHHRAQLIVYLRINGIKPPGIHVGWVFCEKNA